MTKAPIAWAWLALAAVALLGAAFVFRYEPMTGGPFNSGSAAWDRWTDRICYIGLDQGPPACSIAELPGRK